MDTNKTDILLGSAKHKLGTNEDNFIGVELSSFEREILSTEDSYVVDLYKQYFKEKDSSQNYRLAFTITPYCTNVLFNVVTEPVYKEGSDKCFLFTKTSIDSRRIADINAYNESYKGIRAICLSGLVEDTGYSHPNAGAVKYHCGYDIFNNHLFRKRNFVIVNKLSDSIPAEKKKYFNTIRDYVRDYNGKIRKNNLLRSNGAGNIVGQLEERLYKIATIDSYSQSIANNLTERNGWLGFINASSIPVDNYHGNSINKIMNDHEVGDFIDMYPDRTLYSFVPKYNEYRKRVESNWDYCITYPFSSTSENYLIKNEELEISGIKSKLVSHFNSLEDISLNTTFKSLIKHNLSEGDYITLSFIDQDNNVKTTKMLRVVNVGINDGEDSDYYFSVRTNLILNELFVDSGGGSNPIFVTPKEVRLNKYENGTKCEYYIRIFKKLQTYNSQLNKLAFSQNAYSDQVAQIVFTEDINTENIVDNLNRQISELYLTVIKRNQGHEEWYEGNYTADSVEYSHCFGKVSSGFDLPLDDECKKYNIHRIHNVNGVNGITDSPEKLEDSISISGGINDNVFYGDIVEFSLSKMEETVLEPVYYRFNTAQREYLGDKFNDFIFTEINKDVYESNEPVFTDYSAKSNFRVEKINVIPEGYCYIPHYRLKVRNFREEVEEGHHILLTYSAETSGETSNITLSFDENYYFQTDTENNANSTKIYVYKKKDGKYYELVTTGYCSYVSENFLLADFVIGEAVDVTKDCKIFKHNTEMPEYAYDLKDGSGVYTWRELMSSTEIPSDDELHDSQFTNGAYYFHKNISFYLRRQDPNGDYLIGKEPVNLSEFLIDNFEKDVENEVYKIDNRDIKC